jgi:uncharacterized protein YjbI with pentapeptide repeats
MKKNILRFVIVGCAVMVMLLALPSQAQDDWPEGCELPELEKAMSAASEAQTDGDTIAYLASLRTIADAATNAHIACLGEIARSGDDLVGADLSGANLQEANLYDANLEGVNLSGANLRGANLPDANLEGANLEGAILQGARLENAQLTNALFDESTILPDTTNWAPDIDLTRYTNTSQPNFWLDNLEGVNWRGAELQGAWLFDANLQDANLSGVNLQGANLHTSNLQNADLTGTNLQDTWLAGANLSGADLTNADLRDAWLGSCIDAPPANLQGANLSGANLQRALLGSANLQEVDLTEANLQGANLNEANLLNADLTGAIFDVNTVLPDGGCTWDDGALEMCDSHWTPDTDMGRFTDPEHPDFWDVCVELDGWRRPWSCN